VEFKLENVLVSLHSLKTMGLSSIIQVLLKRGELLQRGDHPGRTETVTLVGQLVGNIFSKERDFMD
jgi:hypothetical protein